MRVAAQSGRVVLRDLEPADAEALEAVLCDAEVMRFSMGIKSRQDCVDFVAEAVREYAETGIGPWAICRPSDSALLGYCRLRRDDDVFDDGDIEIGYRLARMAWGQGLATEAARLAIGIAGEIDWATELVALIDPGNTASIKVAERVGMTRSGEMMLPGYDYPDLLYRLDLSAESVSR